MSSFGHELDKLLDEIHTLLVKKHYAYGVNNLKQHGEFGILVRMSDKLSRLDNLLTKPKIDDGGESIEDTYKDLIGYCLMALLLRRGRL